MATGDPAENTLLVNEVTRIVDAHTEKSLAAEYSASIKEWTAAVTALSDMATAKQADYQIALERADAAREKSDRAKQAYNEYISARNG